VTDAPKDEMQRERVGEGDREVEQRKGAQTDVVDFVPTESIAHGRQEERAKPARGET
jgi:hypothetical protein